jgi:MFS family permease
MPRRPPVYRGWLVVPIAALGMVATFPGRTFGIGLITERLLSDLHLSRVTYAQFNLWATLIGATVCLPVGRLNDRLGARVVMSAVALGLAAALFYLTRVVHGPRGVFVALVLLRTFGQSALSIVSLAVLGKWFRRRLPLATGIFTVAISLGFATMFGVVGAAVATRGWRAAFGGLGFGILFVLLPLAALVLRSTPESAGVALEEDAADDSAGASVSSLALSAAAKTNAFWLYGSASAAYALISSALLLFQESILKERGFDQSTYLAVQIVSLLFGLTFNFVAGWLGNRFALAKMMAVGMAALALSLVGLPFLRTPLHAYAYGALMGASGGVVTVIFFTAWAKVFGPAHVSHIQGAAQLMTVLASAGGPLLLAACFEKTGSYNPMFLAAAPVSGGLAIWAYLSAPAVLSAGQGDMTKQRV